MRSFRPPPFHCFTLTAVRMVRHYLSLVKFSHTIFAMPFALLGFFLGYRQVQQFDSWTLLFVVLCMVFARNAAMGFNRYVDRHIDARNERTRGREIPAGVVSARHALGFVILNGGLFIMAAGLINSLCFVLSPVALLVILGYSYTKRFTTLCHLVLGLGLALAPVGAYIAVTESFSLRILLLGVVVLTWVSGFDIIYALQDADFDRAQSLYSIPAWLGRRGGLIVSTGLHFISAGALLAFGLLDALGWIFWIGAGTFLAFLVYQHWLVKPHDLSKVNLAFFTSNGVASLVFCSLAVADILLLA